MAKSIWNAEDRRALLARFDALKPKAEPGWGKMSASQMVKHCTLPVLSAMGEFAVKPKNTPFKNWLGRKLIIYVLPWPKGAPTAPEFVITDEGDLMQRVADLKTAIEKMVAKGPSQSFSEHAAFGALTYEEWGALTHRHLDHHLRQFNA